MPWNMSERWSHCHVQFEPNIQSRSWLSTHSRPRHAEQIQNASTILPVSLHEIFIQWVVQWRLIPGPKLRILFTKLGALSRTFSKSGHLSREVIRNYNQREMSLCKYMLTENLPLLAFGLAMHAYRFKLHFFSAAASEYVV